MDVILHTGSISPGLQLFAQFSDYERPAVNGISVSMFLTISAPETKPVLTSLWLIVGSQTIARVTQFRDEEAAIAQLAPHALGRAVYCQLSLNRLILRSHEHIDVLATDGVTRYHLGTIVITGNDTTEIVPKVKLRLRPILISSLGRSGSTVLANSIGLHPHVTAVGDYPFEYRFFSYCLHAVNVLTSPANHDTSMGGDAFEQRLLYTIGFNPFNHRSYDRRIGHDAIRDFYENAHARAVAHVMMAQSDEAMTLVAREKPNVVAFTEKMAGPHLASLAHNLCEDVQEIVLIRNFWDMISSMLGFDTKRGIRTFGSEEPRWLQGMARQYASLVQRGRRPESILVRYEDLTRATLVTLSDLLTKLGLNADSRAIDAVASPFEQTDYREAHATQRLRDEELRSLFSSESLARVDAILAAEEKSD